MLYKDNKALAETVLDKKREENFVSKIAKKPQVSPETRQSVIVFREGYSMRQIAKKKRKISFKGVHNCLERLKETGQIMTLGEVEEPDAQLHKRSF